VANEVFVRDGEDGVFVGAVILLRHFGSNGRLWVFQDPACLVVVA
jgi:hypothetical protein